RPPRPEPPPVVRPLARPAKPVAASRPAPARDVPPPPPPPTEDLDRPLDLGSPPETPPPVGTPKGFDPFESTTAKAARRPGDRMRLPTTPPLRRSRRREPPPRLRVTEPGLEQV